MSNTVSSALLIMRRVVTYLSDIEHILKHEIPTKKEVEEMLKYTNISRSKLDTINWKLDG